jgi:hypothetical protein
LSPLVHRSTMSFEALQNSHTVSVALSSQFIVLAPAIFFGPDKVIDNGIRSDFVLYATKGLKNRDLLCYKVVQ